MSFVEISAPNAMENCDHPSNFATGQKCFAAQFPCPYFYIGFDGIPDFARAFNVCKAGDFDALMALMYLNGEGTARDLNKAEAVLSAWKKRGRHGFNSYQAATIQKAIDQCRRVGEKTCPRLDYCKDLAGGTLEMEICDAAEQIRAETSLSKTLETVRRTLTADQREEFDRMVADFKSYQDQEDGRAYEALGNGTARGLAGNGQAAFVRESFSKLIHKTIEGRKLQPVTIASYEKIAREADQEYRRDLRLVLSFQREDLKDPTRKSSWAEDRSKIEEYEKAAQDSRAQWLKFRDSCAQLASSLYRDQSDRLDPAVSMKAAVTKLRIAELQYDPLGPEPSQESEKKAHRPD